MARGIVRVVSQLVARPGREDALRDVLRELVEPSRRDPGCLRYELLQRQDDPTRFVFVEEWESDGALDAHLAAPHIQDAFPRLEPLLVAPPDIARYERVA